MDGWMDSLSEDWVSQPHLSSSPTETSQQNRTSSAATNHDVLSKNGTIREASPLENQVTSRKYVRRASRGQAALVERHPNHGHHVSPQHSARRSPKPSELRLSGMHGEAVQLSGRFSLAGTMQRRETTSLDLSGTSRTKERQLPSDAAWRERLLGNEQDHSGPRNLFSPIRLEDMFRAPASQPRSRLPVPEGRGPQRFTQSSPLRAGGSEPRRNDEIKQGSEAALESTVGPISLSSLPPQRKNNMVDESRKGSIQTRDFLDEAERVMAFIRARGEPPRSEDNLARWIGQQNPDVSMIEEQSGEDLMPFTEYESTVEEFSRPPSREKVHRIAAVGFSSPDDDIKANDDLGGSVKTQASELVTKSSLMAKNDSSRKSGRSVQGLQNSENRDISHENRDLNIRITENSDDAKDVGYPGPEGRIQGKEGCILETITQSSGSRSGTSTSRTLHTGSSSKSDTRVVIPPQAVSHLVSGEIAGMTFDHNKHAWVKRKRIQSGDKQKNDSSRLDGSTDDPFRDIPDLTVDGIEELQNTDENAPPGLESQTRRHSSGNEESSPQQLLEKEMSVMVVASDEPFSQSAIVLAKGTLPLFGASARSHSIPSDEFSGVVAHHTQHSPAEIEAFAAQQNANGRMGNELANTPKPVEEVEAEIKLHEGRGFPAFGPEIRKRRSKRDLTITFSSPLVSHSFQIPAASPSIQAESPRRSEHQLDPEEPSKVNHEIGIDCSTMSNHSDRHSHPLSSSSCFKPSRLSAAISCDGGPPSRSNVPRSVRGDHEFQRTASQETTVSRRPSYGVSVTTPLRLLKKRDQSSKQEESVLQRSQITFHLSPLPDFTLNQNEESLRHEGSALTKRMRGGPRKMGSRVLSLTARDLVRRLTDLEPYEPYWEYIRQLDLSSAGLTTLHCLAEFCGRVEKLDASKNRTTQLTGIPSTVRYLNVHNNCLSSLTTWAHLRNVQYLNISNNEIDSLRAFRGLIHLRELKADSNIISSLEGILELDGLIKLDVSRNDFEELDFSDAALCRLTHFNARYNRLTTIRNLHHLPKLVFLNLDHNVLPTFGYIGPEPLHNLHTLRLSGNLLESIDISGLSSLRSLCLDENRLQIVIGLESVEHLERLSIRDQEDFIIGASERPSILDSCSELRSLCLSGNVPPALDVKNSFLNLQYLELANTGLQTLPSTFGQAMPNVRTLNLNFNALNDISALAGITRLTKLYIVGNRISRLRKTVQVLSGVRTLKEVDFRHNPLTLGFHSPTTIVRNGAVDGEEQDSDDSKVSAERFTLPPASPQTDNIFRKRFDPETRLRREVYEVLLALRCSQLQIVDGLPFSPETVVEQDEHIEKLIALGVLQLRRDKLTGNDRPVSSTAAA